MHEVAEAMTAARDGLSAPRGRLRVASPVLFSQLAMGRISAGFCAAYPEVTCEVVADARSLYRRGRTSIPLIRASGVAPRGDRRS
jgi:DNA-binding transcriptional LysR family regulator